MYVPVLYSSQHLSVVISSKHCLCLQLELRPTGTPVRLKNPDYVGLKTQTLPDHSLKNARWGGNNKYTAVFVLESCQGIYGNNVMFIYCTRCVCAGILPWDLWE